MEFYTKDRTAVFEDVVEKLNTKLQGRSTGRLA
jgi:hypothetical protein